MDTENLINDILENVDNFNIDDIPGIDLYMDQVTTLLNEKFELYKRNEDDKLLTKTMINNYTKFRLLPAPEKKKYSKDHIIVLIMIYFFKNILSINDTGTLITPAIEQFFHNQDIPLDSIFNQYLAEIKKADGKAEIFEAYKKSQEIFDLDEYENKDYLQTLAFVCMLSYQAYIRQQIIIKLIDTLPDFAPSDSKSDKVSDKEKASGKEKPTDKEKSLDKEKEK